jgi:hypothetical protein
MQFRPPFGQPPSEQSWQPQRDPPQKPAQHQVYPQKQWQQLPYPPQNQAPKKKSRKRLWLMIAVVVVVLVLASAIGLHGTNVSTTKSSGATAAPTQIPTHTQQSTSQSTPVTTTTTAANLQNTKPTHGTPRIAGHISDFYGTYGTPLTTNGKDTLWLLSSDGSLSLDARDTGRGVVGYLAVSAPPSWSKQKVQAFCLGFAPHNYTLDKTALPNYTSGLYIYDSPSGKFALHVSSGFPRYCYMNTLA